MTFIRITAKIVANTLRKRKSQTETSLLTIQNPRLFASMSLQDNIGPKLEEGYPLLKMK